MSLNENISRDNLPSRQFGQRISRWLTRALPGYRSKFNPPEPPEPLPSPSVRRRLTGPSHALPSHAQQQSRFFSQLPSELRREILLSAFGNRTMHMHLSLDHPVLERAKFDVRESGAHGAYPRRRDASAPRQWLWQSCVCHRNPPWIPSEPFWWRTYWQRPDIDRCLEGGCHACRPWLGEWPLKCQVGALGWLLSCRRAYNEGIDLLYTSNTFHLSGERLLTGLPGYILPSRLAQMTSFEVVLSVNGSIDEAPFQPTNPTLFLLLNMLARSSKVRRLYLCLPCPQIRRRVVDDVDLSLIFDAMDTFVRTSESQSNVLQMESESLRQLSTSALTIVDEEESENRRIGYSYQMWRGLDIDTNDTKIERRQWFLPQVHSPLPSSALSKLGHSRGYWIVESPREPDIICHLP